MFILNITNECRINNIMEADSTTNEPLYPSQETILPFRTGECNFTLYKSIVTDAGQINTELQVIERLQKLGLLPKTVQCPENRSTCNVICKPARVVDKAQWICEGCKKKQPIRIGSFFHRMQCSILQVLQMILAWCEDADINVASKFFDVKPKVAVSIYDKLDELAALELSKIKLGGTNTVVLAEMYPECLNRLSPDTTDQPHVHQILMLADTKHIPTFYRLHVMKGHLKRPGGNDTEDSFQGEVEEFISSVTHSNSMSVSGNNIPLLEGTIALSQLVQRCDVEMQYFLSNRIWNQAITLCNASRDLCSSSASLLCAGTMQRYLDASLYRLRYGDGFYQHMLGVIADRFTDKFDVTMEE